jgi:hypothetical protein
VRGVEGELKKIAESKLSIKPNFAYTLSEVRDDIQRVFDVGYFQQLTPVAEDTRDGIKLTLEVCLVSPLSTAHVAYTLPCTSSWQLTYVPWTSLSRSSCCGDL